MKDNGWNFPVLGKKDPIGDMDKFLKSLKDRVKIERQTIQKTQACGPGHKCP